MIEARIESVFTFGVTVQDMVAATDVHGDLGESDSGEVFFHEEGGRSEDGAQDEEECNGFDLDHIILL